jgi:hypothetical protein
MICAQARAGSAAMMVHLFSQSAFLRQVRRKQLSFELSDLLGVFSKYGYTHFKLKCDS